jgi:hypothetical protein
VGRGASAHSKKGALGAIGSDRQVDFVWSAGAREHNLVQVKPTRIVVDHHAKLGSMRSDGRGFGRQDRTHIQAEPTRQAQPRCTRKQPGPDRIGYHSKRSHTLRGSDDRIGCLVVAMGILAPGHHHRLRPDPTDNVRDCRLPPPGTPADRDAVRAGRGSARMSADDLIDLSGGLPRASDSRMRRRRSGPNRRDCGCEPVPSVRMITWTGHPRRAAKQISPPHPRLSSSGWGATITKPLFS